MVRTTPKGADSAGSSFPGPDPEIPAPTLPPHKYLPVPLCLFIDLQPGVNWTIRDKMALMNQMVGFLSGSGGGAMESPWHSVLWSPRPRRGQEGFQVPSFCPANPQQSLHSWPDLFQAKRLACVPDPPGQEQQGTLRKGFSDWLSIHTHPPASASQVLGL